MCASWSFMNKKLYIFWVQFASNFCEWVFFSKALTVRAASGSVISAFWKTQKCKLIPDWTRKTLWLLNYQCKHEKIREEEGSEDLSRSYLFPIYGNVFQSFRAKFSSSCDIIGLEISFCLSANHNPELRWFALVLHFNCTVLSQSESSNFFLYMISIKVFLLCFASDNKYYYISWLVRSLWLVNLAGRTLLYGPLKFKVDSVAKLFCDLSQLLWTFIASKNLKQFLYSKLCH